MKLRRQVFEDGWGQMPLKEKDVFAGFLTVSIQELIFFNMRQIQIDVNKFLAILFWNF